jgi:ceramide glucosyltransferase
MSDVLAWGALAWFAAALVLLAASFLVALAFPGRGAAPGVAAAPPLTAIVPIKELDPEFDAAQASLFEQDYPELQIVIASADADSAALRAAKAIMARHPRVAARVVVSQSSRAASPKLNNLWAPIEGAGSDLVLTKDSNTKLGPGDLRAFAADLAKPGVGLVSAIPILTAPGSPAAWAEASLINGCYARMLMLAHALGLGFGVGKIMLFRKSDLDRAGGLASVAWALGEDNALTAAMAGLGLKTRLSDRLVRQSAGERRWREVWNRLLRWKLIWRVQAPLVFVGSLFCSATMTAAAGALAAPLMDLSPWPVAAATLLVWWAAEAILCAIKGWPTSARSPLAFVERELIDLAVWLRALTTSQVAWAGAQCRSAPPSGSRLAAELGGS